MLEHNNHISLTTGSMSRRSGLILFFFLAYFISWMVWLPLYLPHFGIGTLPVLPYHHAIGAYGPLLSAIVVSGLLKKDLNHLSFPAHLFKWKAPVFWYIIALLSPFVLYCLAFSIASLIAGQHGSISDFGKSIEFPHMSFLSFFLYNLITFGIGEEIGWRGFALPLFQERFSAFTSTIILSMVWAVWHLPLFLYRPGYTTMDVFGIMGWYLSLLTGAILLTWIYNKTKGSLLVVSIFHATIDIAFTSVKDSAITNTMGALITLWGIVIGFWMWRNHQKVPS